MTLSVLNNAARAVLVRKYSCCSLGTELGMHSLYLQRSTSLGKQLYSQPSALERIKLITRAEVHLWHSPSAVYVLNKDGQGPLTSSLPPDPQPFGTTCVGHGWGNSVRMKSCSDHVVCGVLFDMLLSVSPRSVVLNLGSDLFVHCHQLVLPPVALEPFLLVEGCALCTLCVLYILRVFVEAAQRQHRQG